jgi:hypothetical protein
MFVGSLGGVRPSGDRDGGTVRCEEECRGNLHSRSRMFMYELLHWGLSEATAETRHVARTGRREKSAAVYLLIQKAIVEVRLCGSQRLDGDTRPW